jgi:lysozyme family protein
MPTYEQSKAGYLAMWGKCQITPSLQASVTAAVARIIARKADYQAVEKATGVPWFMTGALDYRESNLDPTTYLGNGDPLNRKTIHVPRNRGPFPSWSAGAIDSFEYQGFTKITQPWTIALILYEEEDWNGEGYEEHDENSPYVWAGTNLEQEGEYPDDGVYDPTMWDRRLGTAALLKGLIAADLTIQVALDAAEAAEAVAPAAS